MSRPDFAQFQKILRREVPDRPVLFETYIDWQHIFATLGDETVDQDNPPFGWVKNCIRAYEKLGYKQRIRIFSE